jgi:chromosome partitioning protein
MTVLVVSNQKGGVGKTTTAISLGAAMVEHGQRVLIVDLDPQANATSGLGISKERANGIYGVLLRERAVAEAVVPTGVPGLDLVPSGSYPQACPALISFRQDRRWPAPRSSSFQ